MNRSLNKVLLIGEVLREPEMRYTPSGRPVTTFLLETNRNWVTSDGEKHSDTERFHIVAFGNLAESCSQQFEKGCQVYVEGRLQSRQWEDRDGIKHNSVEIHALDVLFLSSSGDSEETAGEDLMNLDLNEISF